MRARGARGRVEGADVARGGPQQPGEFRAFGLAPAGAHAPDVTQPPPGALPDQHRPRQSGEPSLAALPAADQDVLGAHVADLDPGPGAHPRFVHRVQPFADQALQAVRAGGGQGLGAVADQRGRGRPGGTGEPEVLQCRAASRVGEPDQRMALQMHQVEEHEVDRDLRRPPRRPGGRVGQAHPRLEQLEVRTALFVQRQDLPVQHGGRGPERGAQRPKFGVRGRDVLPGPGPQQHAAVPGEIGHHALAVLLGLIGPARVLRGGRQGAGRGEHGRDQRQVHG